MQIKPFPALQANPELVDQIAALPYDVVTTEEAKSAAADNPACFFHISRPEIDLPAGTAATDPAVYKKAAQNFHAFQTHNYLIHNKKPGLYLYRLRTPTHDQCGLVTVCSVNDYENAIIKKHEKTRPVPEEDRLRHIQALQAQTGLVYLAYRDQEAITHAMDNVCRDTEPIYDFTATDLIRHTVWSIPNPERFVQLFAEVPTAYIADGHHRAAAAARNAREQRQGKPADHTSPNEWFLGVLFPASQLKILPYNRCVKDLQNFDRENFLHQLNKSFHVQLTGQSTPDHPHKISLYLDQEWLTLTPLQPIKDDPVASLDVSILQDLVLTPILNITDPRNDNRLEFHGGWKSVAKIQERVDSGAANMAFSLYPTTIDQLITVADADRLMPPKSTWFEPKLRSGMLIYPLATQG